MLQQGGLASLEELIVAPGSAPGASPRAVVRLSGQGAVALTLEWFEGAAPPKPGHWESGALRFPGVEQPIPVLAAVWGAGKSYTGQEMAEWHLPGSPALVDIALEAVRLRGARLAEPGEFTRRAFLSSRIDLPRAEALMGLAGASTPDDLRQALDQHAGGLSEPLSKLHEALLDLLADLEAGLDFAEEDIDILPADQLLVRLAGLLAHATLAWRKLETRGDSSRRPRVALVGMPNAGKSRLFNLLTGSEALVSPVAGTTRDWLAAPMKLGGSIEIELIDTAGLGVTADPLAEAVRASTVALLRQVDLLVVCHPADSIERISLDLLPDIPSMEIITRADTSETREWEIPACSSVTGEGLGRLVEVMTERIGELANRRGAPHLARSREQLEKLVGRLRAAHAIALDDEGSELVALELRHALDSLGEIAGTITSDDLLGRVFSRFCIGK